MALAVPAWKLVPSFRCVVGWALDRTDSSPSRAAALLCAEMDRHRLAPIDLRKRRRGYLGA
jgi:hypothetical protein